MSIKLFFLRLKLKIYKDYYNNIKFYRKKYKLTPEIEQRIVNDSKRYTKSKLVNKYNLDNIYVVNTILSEHGCTASNCLNHLRSKHYKGKRYNYKEHHPCYMYNKIKGKHDNVTRVFKIDNTYIQLCWYCVSKLNLFSNEMPEWYNDDSIDLLNDLNNYVKQNPNLKLTITFFPSSWYMSGYFFSKKNNNNILFQSKKELNYLQEMEQDDNILKYDRGPSIQYIDYFNGNKKRKYEVDFKILYKNNVTKLVECKPFKYIISGRSNKKESIIPKLEAVENYCKHKDYIFEFWD